MKLTLSVLACCLLASSSLALANRNSCETGYLHCAYSRDTGSDPQQGKWLKIESTDGNGHKMSEVLCMSFGSSNSIDSEIAHQDFTPGKITWTFSTCADQQCSKSTYIGTDTFTLTEHYTVEDAPLFAFSMKQTPEPTVKCQIN